MNTPVVREILDREEWNELILGLPTYDLRQGYEWGEVRASQRWSPRRIAVFQGPRCVAAVSILVKRVTLLKGSMMYAPGGPLLSDVANEAAWRGLLEGIRRVALETRSVFFRVNPSVPNGEAGFREALAECGFRHLQNDWTTWNTPRITMTMDVREPEDALKRRLRKRHREYIASASKRGIAVRRTVSLDEARGFHKSLVAAGRRKGLPVRGFDYFEWLWKEYLQSGRGVLLLAEHAGKAIGGLLGAKMGKRAYMLYVTLGDKAGGEIFHQGPILYWEFVRWAKESGCDMIDWGGSGTRFPPQESDPGFGVYRFKSGFNSSIEYLTGYYDLVFRPLSYIPYRVLERTVSETAWTVRARLNGRVSQMRALVQGGIRKARQLRVSIAQRGLGTTAYWAAFGYLKPNQFVVLARDLSSKDIGWLNRDRVAVEVWEASAIRSWRKNRQGLSTEFYQDQIDGVGFCSVALVDGTVAGLIWIYQPEDVSRLFHLRESEAELNNGYILPEYRGMGLFKDVLSYACLWLREQGCKTVYAGVHSANLPSLRAFRGAGFEEVGSLWHLGFLRPKYHANGGVKRMAHSE